MSVLLNEDHQIVKIESIIHKNQYEKITRILKEKYPVKHEIKPVMGNKHILLVNEDTLITASAPHISFNMTLAYTQKDYAAIEDQHLQISRQKQAQAEKKLF